MLGAPVAVVGGAGAPRADRPGALVLHGVRAGPLRDLELAVAPGEVLGIACADLAESAALVDLLGRERDPTAGRIELDGVPLTELEPRALREAVLVAEHDAALFEGTAREVIEAGRDGRDLDAALVVAAADEVLENIPGGLDGEVSARGRSLSGGQRQRLALARALAARPPILVLHEPTTAVDAASEAGIAERLPAARRGLTTIVVATSPALLGIADRVVHLDGGAVVDDGAHRELLDRGHRYRELVLA